VVKSVPKQVRFLLSAKNRYNGDGDIYMPMTKLMEQVIAKVSALPPEEQEYYATIFLDELKDEQKWDDAFVISQDQLAELADEALREFEAGKTTPLDFSTRRK
jgi:hypothetical protein